MVSGVLTVAVPSLPPPRMLSRWILIVWWGVAALSSAGHLVFFNLFGDSSLRLCSGAVLRVSRARLAELNARLGIG
jgi:hypothetical protein